MMKLQKPFSSSQPNPSEVLADRRWPDEAVSRVAVCAWDGSSCDPAWEWINHLLGATAFEITKSTYARLVEFWGQLIERRPSPRDFIVNLSR